AYTAAPIARHQRSSTQLTSLLINNAEALGSRGVPPVASLPRYKFVSASSLGGDLQVGKPWGIPGKFPGGRGRQN
ncbi:hypothetical protein OSH39_23000, partial [Mycobacterium ulcerans]|nr:hypothetical protein [Mycobacterium ulcerans]MEB3933791.1 hypothetical protein [Mycobacterium ulcerans]MEB3992122.1 hypothetical protein [Mycobacterium ulcerans]MEB4000384.1 hypothetical protein [Mycobacterium ulcerans]MEB4029331.1 hypothetical protein [Mycobacterium ulcerans]